jgi:hypothetical protein
VWWWGEERNKIKRKGNEGSLGGEKNFGGFLAVIYERAMLCLFFLKGFFLGWGLPLAGTQPNL